MSKPTLPELVRDHWPNLGGPGVVAVSGGADSVALLRTLESSVEPLVVAHLNHRLRGEESDADESFVRAVTADLGLPFETIAIDVGAEANRMGENLESTARQLRYDWLAQVAGARGAAWIATGHTADDQAETVLHRLVRGAGIQGLRGIAQQREIRPGVRLIRPLLHVTRADVLTYLYSINQTWREDRSNLDLAFTRNRIRHELLPLLRSFNPAIGAVLGRLADQANETHDEQEASARQLLAEAELPSAGPWRIFRTTRLQSATPAQVRGMFRLLWQRENWPQQDMTFEHWKRLVAVATGVATASDLPGGITARHRDSVLQVGSEKR